ncbi:MAG TPA: ABC-F family ATP-binding cassette domain-containing protein [Geminicoccaceae bacterium]|nr:ABC-F family ATP-binding cassette domain-containing protein [Geminicoccaceae bacterium]
MLHLNDVTLRVGGRVLLDRASAHVPAGHRVALIGRNGAGKTSLLRLIAGELQPDGGELRLPRGARVATVAQEAPGGDATPLEAVLAADAERAALLAEAETAREPARIAEVQTRLADIRAHAAPARAAVILKGLGFDEDAQARPLSGYSGGWRMRVALAAVLFAEPDLLLLDEPTNHLDLEASIWLEEYLRSYRHTLLLVSHDRELLTRGPDRVLHLSGGRLTGYSGGYDRFARTRAEQRALQEKTAAKQEARRRHMQAFVDRFRYKASKARQAQSRLKALERLGPIEPPDREPDVVLRFPETDVPPPPLVTLDRVRAGYGGTVVLDRLTLRLDPDDRIALLGANGNGKSTFARVISGRLAPMAGEIVRPPNLRVGYFAQHQIEELDPERSGIEHVAARRPQEREERIRAHLGRFGLTQDKAERPAAQLSGGEKARLTFALMCLDAPQILILDEPTNHLDIESREALVEALNAFPGAVLLISHDRHLIELTADRLWLVADGTVRPYDGDLEEYRQGLLAAAAAETSRQQRPEDNGKPPGRKQAAAERRSRVAPLRQAARGAERELERLMAERQGLQARLADPATYAAMPGGELAELGRRGAELDERIAAAEAAWLAAEEAIEAAEG